jgi:hypothetical protein
MSSANLFLGLRDKKQTQTIVLFRHSSVHSVRSLRN